MATVQKTESEHCYVDIYTAYTTSELCLRVVSDSISAGFPSPAGDFIEQGIDLNKDLIEHPSSTFFARVKGRSMEKAGINDGAILVIDKSLTPRNRSIIVCFIDGEYTVKRFDLRKDHGYLLPENDNYEPIRIS